MKNKNKQPKFESNTHKIRLGLNLNNFIVNTNISHYPAVYLASGLDLEFPLILRARRIIMMDPIFLEEDNVNKIIQKIHKYDTSGFTHKKISAFHNHFTFNFDFGYGQELVHLDLFAKTYQEFNYLSPIGYIIEFNNDLDHCLYKADLLERLVTNGLIIDNTDSPLKKTSSTIFEKIFYGSNPEKSEERRASNIGLNTIRLEEVPFSIYQKIKNTSKLLSVSQV